MVLRPAPATVPVADRTSATAVEFKRAGYVRKDPMRAQPPSAFLSGCCADPFGKVHEPIQLNCGASRR